MTSDGSQHPLEMECEMLEENICDERAKFLGFVGDIRIALNDNHIFFCEYEFEDVDGNTINDEELKIGQTVYMSDITLQLPKNDFKNLLNHADNIK
jgi:hypothetical protein